MSVGSDECLLTLSSGPIIRLGPNEVHIGDSTFFDTLFGFNKLKKEAMAAKQFGVSNALFGTEDYETWSRRRAAYGDSFSRSKALKITGMMEKYIDRGFSKIQETAEKGKAVDLA